MARNERAIVTELRDFIRAAPKQDNKTTAPSATAGGFQTGVLQPSPGDASVEHMLDNYRQCLGRLTDKERLVLDRIINTLSEAP